jgi:hypothetical protein
VAISEAARSDLYNGLSQVLGPERAETLMSAIPLHDLDEVATKGDLALLSADLRTEMGDLRSELRTEMSDLRTEMAELRAELKTDIAELRADMITEVGALRSSMANWMLTLLIAIVAAMASIGVLS